MILLASNRFCSLTEKINVFQLSLEIKIYLLYKPDSAARPNFIEEYSVKFGRAAEFAKMLLKYYNYYC